ncbi:hypothetical protein NVV95_10165 [Herbiconiux sp. CPCC 205716]|uniref:Uncharacterized protein n=1 Tax=Herbiconiux gentiana TaxID=2970912 RepID=A0ABT2GJF7_9MICO|nr:hypothetical protein [Herbiconiux gentiana]MCS5714916.1 hypothetical protein [Herbiconiux gentiana]
MVVEWKHGVWHARPRSAPGEVVARSLGDLPPDIAGHGHAPVLRLPQDVQQLLDDAQTYSRLDCPEATRTSRRKAATLLRSRLMSDADIARCLGLTVESLRSEVIAGTDHHR